MAKKIVHLHHLVTFNQRPLPGVFSWIANGKKGSIKLHFGAIFDAINFDYANCDTGVTGKNDPNNRFCRPLNPMMAHKSGLEVVDGVMCYVSKPVWTLSAMLVPSCKRSKLARSWIWPRPRYRGIDQLNVWFVRQAWRLNLLQLHANPFPD